MDDLQFTDGLLWYLKTRNWAFEKIESMSKGSQEPLDIQMYHYLYFSNLLGAVDYVREHLDSFDIITNFEMQLGNDNYSYIRELRNSVERRSRSAGRRTGRGTGAGRAAEAVSRAAARRIDRVARRRQNP
jgi:hypothetical protein